MPDLSPAQLALLQRISSKVSALPGESPLARTGANDPTALALESRGLIRRSPEVRPGAADIAWTITDAGAGFVE